MAGGNSRLELRSTSVINGNVVTSGGNNTLALGGAANGSFDVSAIGAAAQYQGFTGFEKTGAGTWTLTGATTEVTPWTLTEGVLSVSSDANLGNPVSGGLTFDGGTLRMTGAALNLYSGRNVVLNAGGGSLDIVNADFLLSLSNGVTGAGGLTKSGAGTLQLQGTNTYLGATVVDAGMLHVAPGASIASSSGTTVNGGGFVVNGVASGVNVLGGYLGGTGTVAATTIGNGGTLAPGNSIGTITVNGSLAFAPGSTYEVEVSPTDADRTNVKAVGGAGTADLSGATVVPVYEPGSYIARRYVIVEADGGLGGTRFAGLAGTAPSGVVQSLDYDANNAYLKLSMLQLAGLNDNQQAVSDALAAYFDLNGLPGAFIGLSPDQLTLLSAENGTAAQQAGLFAAGRFLSTIGDPWLGGASAGVGADGAGAGAQTAYAQDDAAAAHDSLSRRFEAAFATQAQASASTRPASTRPASTRSVWGSALGGGQWLAGNAAIGSQAGSTALAGIASGIDWQAEGTRAGLALGASWSNAGLVSGLGSASDGTFSIGARASHDFGGFYLSGAAAYGLHVVSTSRAVGAETYTAAFTGHSFSGRAEAGARLSAGRADVLPYAAFQATAFSNPAYGETGSGAGTFALNYAARTTVETRSELGLRLSHRSEDAAGATTLSGRIAWAHYFNAARTASAGFAALPGTSFLSNGAAKASDTALVSLDYQRSWGNKTASLGLDGEFGAGTIAAGAKASIRIRW